MRNELERQAARVRRRILTLTSISASSHVGSSLSCVELVLASLQHRQKVRSSGEQGFVVVSKGHAAAAVYSSLVELGEMGNEMLDNYGANGSSLMTHVSSAVPGVDFSTGSLGHGLPFSVGLALGIKRKGLAGSVVCIMSDGELDEGTTWESLLIASHLRLDNLKILIDRNGLQSLTGTEETIGLEPLVEKFQAFRAQVTQVDGHSIKELTSNIEADSDTVKVVIARTVKGKGVSFMENSVAWHYRSPSETELKMALAELAEHG